MNKIEEIIFNCWEKDRDEDNNPIYYPSTVQNICNQVGKLCFDAGAELTWKSTGDYSGYEIYKYKTFEDFLKEIEK